MIFTVNINGETINIDKKRSFHFTISGLYELFLLEFLDILKCYFNFNILNNSILYNIYKYNAFFLFICYLFQNIDM